MQHHRNGTGDPNRYHTGDPNIVKGDPKVFNEDPE